MKNKDIRIGDNVRFLNDVGGGVVTRIEGKIIYVEDEIGFEVPVSVAEVVVVEHREKPSVEEPAVSRNPWPVEEQGAKDEPDQEEEETARLSEIHDDSNPRFYLAFLDAGNKNETQNVDLHIVNDSNYFCLYVIVEVGEDGLARERFNGRIPPNTKEYLDQVLASKLDVKWKVQAILYRPDKPFQLFEPVNEWMKIKASRFYRDNVFKVNDFFYEKAVLLPVIKNELERQMESLSKQETYNTLKGKGEAGIKTPKNSKKERPDIIEIDLHIHELLDDTRGLSNADMLKIQMDRFQEVMEENIKNRGQKIVFIHGIGSGTLKHEVRRQLNTRYKKHSFQDASFREYGYGATMVII